MLGTAKYEAAFLREFLRKYETNTKQTDIGFSKNTIRDKGQPPDDDFFRRA